jgi:hypothetical protein
MVSQLGKKFAFADVGCEIADKPAFRCVPP